MDTFDDPLWAFRLSTQTPEQLLEDVWPYFDMTPEQRDLDSRSVCRAAIEAWNGLSPEIRANAEWYDAWQRRRGLDILAAWAREYRERQGTAS